MEPEFPESLRRFEAFIAATGGTCVFTGDTAVEGFGLLLRALEDMGLDPANTAAFRRGIERIFRIEYHNLPDLEHRRWILAPNHVSDVDAVVLGLLHPGIRIVSKDAWTGNERLRQFLNLHYKLYGLDRSSLQSLRALLADAVDYFADGEQGKHFLVFSQGTISDFNRNSAERISTLAQKVSLRADVPIIPVFLEQVSLQHPTRIVFDRPMRLTRKDDFRTVWLERQAVMQNALSPPARMPKLTHKHANNNRPGDPFF